MGSFGKKDDSTSQLNSQAVQSYRVVAGARGKSASLIILELMFYVKTYGEVVVQGFSKVGESVILRPVLRPKDPRSREQRPFGSTLLRNLLSSEQSC